MNRIVHIAIATYSNLENHPRLIRARDNKVVPKITLDPRTGLPIAVDETNARPKRGKPAIHSISEEDEEELRRKPCLVPNSVTTDELSRL